nr:MAG TPA: hypothetical protein [Caudoviricetes sp.]DAS01783.1 MAG TPA: hypothetical protein [Caudoviricetes sp.]
MSLTFFEQRRRLLARQREMEEVNRDQVIETVTEGETTEDSKPKKTVKGKE